MINKKEALIAKSNENANLLTELTGHIEIFYNLEDEVITTELLGILPDFIIDDTKKINLISHLSKAIGINGMVFGQSLDMECSFPRAEVLERDGTIY